MDYANNVIIILPSGIAPDYLGNIPDLNYAYVNIYHWRKSLLAKMCTKTYCRNSTYSRMAAPLIALLLPEKPEIAHEIAQLYWGKKNYPRLSG